MIPQIYFFATEGTLLGAVRDKTWFMPIVQGSRGTQDFDFGIRWDDYEKHFLSTTGINLNRLPSLSRSQPAEGRSDSLYWLAGRSYL